MEYFRSVRNEQGSVWILFEELQERFLGLTAKQLQNKMDYLVKSTKSKDDQLQKQGVGKQAEFRIKPVALNARVTARVNSTIDDDMEMTEGSNPQDLDIANGMVEVPPGEPFSQFQVIGTLVGSGEMILKGVTPGVLGVWRAERIA